MMDSCIRMVLDIRENRQPVILRAKRGDTGRVLRISLSDGSTPYTITPDCYAVFTGKKPDQTTLYNRCTVENNEIVYVFTEQTCSAVGRIKAEIRLYGGDNKLLTSGTFLLDVRDTVWHEGDVESRDEMDALDALILETAALKSQVEHKLENGEFQGLQGEQGPPGPRGPKGEDGSIVFEELTPEQMELLRGPEGQPGKDGQDGYTPRKGVDYFDGQEGQPGKDGKDGTSPVISVSNIAGGHRITIIDSAGKTNFDVMDGSDGQTPQKGVDYFDGQDGKDGTSVTVSNVSESSASGGTNVVTFSDGKKVSIKNGKDGQNGDVGQRGTGILKVTTAPSSYTTATGGKNPIKRMSISTIKTQANVDEVLVGDLISYSYYLYHVYYLDATYAYMDMSQSIRGSQGEDGDPGPEGPQGPAYTLTDSDKTTIVNSVLTALPTWTGGSY